MHTPDTASEPAAQELLVRSLAAELGAPGAPAQLFETHISWVIVLPTLAYKIKRALRLPFVDYSTLAARRFFCDEEIRLNRQLAPELYLGVAAIGGTPTQPLLDAAGPVLEYAVKMRAFDQSALWSHRLRQGQLGAGEARQLARLLARFHHGAPHAAPDTAFGGAAAVTARTDADLAEIALLAGSAHKELLAQVSAWHARQRCRLAARFERRKAAGWVRECHGDLHCANILTIDGRVQAFDAIEFNPGMRWIDVAQDLAFAWMDLQCGGRADLAARLLSDYLQLSGDEGALAVLPYYRIQRALVRCKVALHRGAGFEAGAGAARHEAHRYLAFAASCTKPGAPAMLIAHGFSGSGKSSVCELLVEPLGALHIRSDIERKRLFGLDPLAGAAAAPDAGIYARDAGLATYRRLACIALHALAAGLPLLVDASFLRRSQRSRFRRLARRLAVPFAILSVQASRAVLAARVAARSSAGGDPSDAGPAVLAHQYRSAEPLAADETDAVIAIDNRAGGALSQQDLLALVARALPQWYGSRARPDPATPPRDPA